MNKLPIKTVIQELGKHKCQFFVDLCKTYFGVLCALIFLNFIDTNSLGLPHNFFLLGYKVTAILLYLYYAVVGCGGLLAISRYDSLEKVRELNDSDSIIKYLDSQLPKIRTVAQLESHQCYILCHLILALAYIGIVVLL